MLIMNLSVAAVIEGLETARKENSGTVQAEDIDKALNIWQDYDPKASGWITTDDLVFFLFELPKPFVIKQKRENKELNGCEPSSTANNKGNSV